MAQIFLKVEEFCWLEKWLNIRAGLNPNTNLVFCIGSRGCDKYLVRFLQRAWADMTLPGVPTFTDIRTTVAHHVSLDSPIKLIMQSNVVLEVMFCWSLSAGQTV